MNLARSILIIFLLSSFLNGCADIPIKDGELSLGKDTSAGMEGAGVAKIKRKF